MHSATLPTYSHITPKATPNSGKLRSLSESIHRRNSANLRNRRCEIRSSNGGSDWSVTELDLYDLLGIESSSDQARIKLAYRALQKRCHPDIAGPAGHDMAIILNQAYALLSDPTSRMAYDKEQAKIEDLRGYTGKPLYSVWLGSENEERAIFVDEVKCVGCLKCALSAQKTFAIESTYGRARVVAQWADPEDKIQEAIGACPVDCISVVERSNLAALEFLMSKQQRGSVRVGSGNTGGARVSNIFADLEKFQARYLEALKKGSKHESEVANPQKEARMSAIHAIRSMANWLYWQAPKAGAGKIDCRGLLPVAKRSPDINVEKLRNAATARRQGIKTKNPAQRILISSHSFDEYWKPVAPLLPEATSTGAAGGNPQAKKTKEIKKMRREESTNHRKLSSNPLFWAFPMATAASAAFVVLLQVGEMEGGGSVHEHIGGSFALGVVNSSWLQVILASVTWYLIGLYSVEVLDALHSLSKKFKK